MSVAYAGRNFSIEWFQDTSGKSQPREFYESLSIQDRAKTLALFERMADTGKIFDRAKFRHEAGEIYVFKPRPHRFLSCFWKGKRIVVLTGFTKKSQKLPKRELKRAQEYLNKLKLMEGERND
jgi:phage-related protein